jgi:adenylosuccinate lyase
MLNKITNLYKNLLGYPEKMKSNMEITHGLYRSEAVMLSLIRKGLTRQEAYKITQRIAMACYDAQGDFISSLLQDEELKKYLSKAEIAELASDEHYFAHVDTIFKRVFSKQ